MRLLGLLAVVSTLFSIHAHSQIWEIREQDGKRISCLHSGLFSDLEDCGVRADWYSYVFVGAIDSVIPAADGEFELGLAPVEVFSGSPGSRLTVRTSQGACLLPLKAGDRWLFYLRKTSDKPIVLDYYGNDSKPIEQAKQEIETLQHLQSIGHKGILRGSVESGGFSDSHPVGGAHLHARNQSSREDFTATTDSDGRYEFQPLRPGTYEIRVEPVGSFQADGSSIDLKAGQCWDMRLARSLKARISGHIRFEEGKPAADAAVILFADDNENYNIQYTDNEGYFDFDSLWEGKFVVGINPPGAPKWKYGSAGGKGIELPPVALFYHGAINRATAEVIKLNTDERRDDIDFILPSQ